MKELLINPPFHSLMGQDQSYVPLNLLWAANIAKDPGIYNFEITKDLDSLSFSNRLVSFERYLESVNSSNHKIWERVSNVINEYNPEEIWMTHYYAKELSINKISEIAKKKGVKVRIKRPYEPPYPQNKIKYKRGFYESLLQEYNKDNLSHIFTSCGCPYKCGFCLSDSKVQYRKIDDILYEMDYLLSNYSCDLFTFWDDAFTLSKKRLKRFVELKSKSLSANVKYMCESRADSLDENTVKMLKESGCVNVSIGFETGSQRLLNLIQKGENIKDYYKAADLLNKYSLNWKAYAMIGFPTETEKEVNLTFDLMKKTSPNKITVSVFTPYPKTSLTNQFCNNESDVIRMCHQFKNKNLTAMDDVLYERKISEFFKKTDLYNKQKKIVK